jgi:uncharacterized protein YfaS (alpha-2-macroglobulin family)
MKKTALFLFFAIILPPLLAAPLASVQILPDSGKLEPSTTLEFRFPEPMVSADSLGPAPKAPVVFEPPLPGDFTWLSTRSGLFSPRGPIPLGAFFTVTLRPGLKSPDGKPVRWKLSKKLSTPTFNLTAFNTGIWDAKRVSPNPVVKLAFNLPVTLEPAAFQFVDASGHYLPAKIRPLTDDDFFKISPEAEDWNLRWKLVTDPAAASNPSPQRPNCLVVEPAQPLPPSTGWKLVINAGLSDTTGNFRLAKPRQIELGNVPPFTLAALEAENYINSGPTLFLKFTDGLAPDITPESAQSYFRFEPEVADLTWEADYNQMIVRGPFELARPYRLFINDAVFSSEGVPFTGERTVTVTFAPVLPRLYLPDLILSQILGGRRELPVRSVNLASLHITARLVPPSEAARALSVFQANEWNYRDEQKVPTDDLPGQILLDETIPLPDPVIDKRQTTLLDWTRILGNAKAGVLMLSLEGTPLPGVPQQTPAAQAIIQLTDLGILWKKAGDSVRAYVFSLATAAPISSASVRLLDAAFAPLATAQTDPDGSATLDFTAVPAWLEVRHGEDTNVLAMGDASTTLSGFSTWQPSAQSAGDFTSDIFTDRPLYQPGEPVQVKGFVRSLAAGGLICAADTEATLILRGPDYEEISRTPITTGSEGAFDTTIKLPPTPPGNHSLHLEILGSTTASVAFVVAEYQPDAFRLTLDIPKQFPASAPDVTATLSGTYFFGGNISDADVRWSLRYSQATFSPPGFDGFDFLGGDTAEEGAKPLTLRGEGRLLGPDPFPIRPPLPVPEIAPYHGSLTAEVTDINQQTVSTTAEFTRQSADFYLGIARPAERVVKLGDDIPLRIIAVQPDGAPIETPLEASISIHRWTYNIVRTQGAGGAMTFRRETIQEPLLEQIVPTIAPCRDGDNWTAGSVAPLLLFKTTTLGHHQIRVTARDAAGRETASESFFYVSGDGPVVWNYKNPVQIDLVSDKSSYQPGDTARILVKTPISGEAFVSIERGATILRTERLALEGNAPVIEIPITPADVPNLDISLVLLRGADASTRKFPTAEFRQGTCQLRIENPASHLQVAISPAQASVQPGDEVESTITVNNHLGEPVPHADVTFYAVDDGILALTGFQRPDPAKALLSPVPLRVLTGLSIAQLLAEDPDDLAFSNKGFLIGGGGEAGPTKLRENFPGTACWLPHLRTDAQGRVTARFIAPDALTRYRLVAVAAAGASSFGSAESSLTISRPLMLLPALGQFANVGDDLLARTVIRNETGHDGTVDVAMTIGATTKSASVSIPTGTSRSVDFPLQPKDPGTLEILWSATLQAGANTFTDRVRSLLPIGSPMLELRETWFAASAAISTDLLADINPQIPEGCGSANVTIANTRLAALADNVSMLLDYPYGCAEQTASALVPWLVLPTLQPVLPGVQKTPDEIQSITETTVAKLFAFQTDSGALAFWPGGNRPSSFASAWAAIVLAKAQENGATLPQAPWKKLLDSLSANLRGIKPSDDTSQLAERALAACALSLAGRPEASYHEQLYLRRAALPLESRALLAVGILAADGPREMAAELLQDDSNAPQEVSPFGNAARTRAILLLAWTKFQPDAPEIARLTAELLATGRRNNFTTTQDNAWALLAFEQYFHTVEKPALTHRDVTGSLKTSSSSVPFQLSATTPSFSASVPIAPENSPAVLSVENPQMAPLYVASRFAVFPPLGDQPRQDRGFAVSRSYRKMASDGSLVPAEDLRVGDRLLITLRLETTRPAQFVAIDDPLPAILEAVNPDFESRAIGGSEETTTQRFISRSETRADRVVFFCDQLPPGSFTFNTLARVRMAGQATAAATKAESMYRPDRFGLGTIQHLTSRPAHE